MAGIKTVAVTTPPVTGATSWVYRGPVQVFGVTCTGAGDGASSVGLLDSCDQKGSGDPGIIGKNVGEPLVTISTASTGYTPINRPFNSGVLVLFTFPTTAGTVTIDYA